MVQRKGLTRVFMRQTDMLIAPRFAPALATVAPNGRTEQADGCGGPKARREQRVMGHKTLTEKCEAFPKLQEKGVKWVTGGMGNASRLGNQQKLSVVCIRNARR